MSKYIDAGLYVEMQIYDDENEEWSLWDGTIEDLLNQWTEQGCPPAIEASERTGHWIYGNGNGKCSICGQKKSMGWDNYCGYCGAEMED